MVRHGTKQGEDDAQFAYITDTGGETHPLRPDFDNRHMGKIVLHRPAVKGHRSGKFRIPREIQRDTFSHSSQRPFGHTTSRQINTTGNGERWGCGDDEAGIKWRTVWEGVNGRQLFVPVDCNWEE